MILVTHLSKIVIFGKSQWTHSHPLVNYCTRWLFCLIRDLSKACVYFDSAPVISSQSHLCLPSRLWLSVRPIKCSGQQYMMMMKIAQRLHPNVRPIMCPGQRSSRGDLVHTWAVEHHDTSSTSSPAHPSRCIQLFWGLYFLYCFLFSVLVPYLWPVSCDFRAWFWWYQCTCIKSEMETRLSILLKNTHKCLNSKF